MGWDSSRRWTEDGAADVGPGAYAAEALQESVEAIASYTAAAGNSMKGIGAVATAASSESMSSNPCGSSPVAADRTER
jgi:hypothetical protein